MDIKVRLSLTLKAEHQENLKKIADKTGVSSSRICENLIICFNKADIDLKLNILSTSTTTENNDIIKTSISVSNDTKNIYHSMKQKNLLSKLVMYFLSLNEQEQKIFIVYHL